MVTSLAADNSQGHSIVFKDNNQITNVALWDQTAAEKERSTTKKTAVAKEKKHQQAATIEPKSENSISNQMDWIISSLSISRALSGILKENYLYSQLAMVWNLEWMC